MLIVRADGVAKEWNGKQIFANVQIEISQGEHIALLGRNGTGKTTFIQALLGKTNIDHGSIQRLLPMEEWGCMEQHLNIGKETTLLEFVYAGMPELSRIKNEMSILEKQLGEPDADFDSYNKLYEQYVNLDGYTWEVRVETYLQKVNLAADLWHLPFNSLSGGQKTRAQLARLAALEPKFLILDEPTNHLDSETMDWLENWIKNYTGAVLIVSHDRYFLDCVAHAIYELAPEGTKRYKGGYTAYRSQKDAQEKALAAQYEKEERERRKLEEVITQYRNWFQKSHNAASERDPFQKKKATKHVTRFKAKEKSLEKLLENRTEKPKETSKVKLSFQESRFEANSLLRVEELSFSYGKEPLFQHLSFHVQKQERIAVIGENGAGKTTLLKLLVGDLMPSAGTVIHHPELKIGYFAQELGKLDVNQTILESILDVPDMTQTNARTLLGCFLFQREDVDKRIGDLSMGERCRVAFVKLYFSGANLLVLDEPTNYLDIDTREVIEQALESYPGTSIIVSHDRYLLQKLATRVLYINGEGTKIFPGTYEEFQNSRLAVSPEQTDAINQIQKLELELAVLAVQEEPETEDMQRELIARMRFLHEELARLKEALQ